MYYWEARVCAVMAVAVILMGIQIFRSDAGMGIWITGIGLSGVMLACMIW